MELKTFRVRATCQCDANEIFDADVPLCEGMGLLGSTTQLVELFHSLVHHGLASGKATFKLEKIP